MKEDNEIMGNMFRRGYQASREEKERQDRQRENAGNRLFRFFLSEDGEEADLRFLTEEPINFYEHNIKGKSSGKDTFTQYTCTGDNCSLCEDGDRPTYKGAYLVVDRREYEYTDKDGKKKRGKNQVRLYIQGMRVISQLDRISEKYGLTNRDVTVVRLGTGTSTTYTIERGDEEKLTTKEIESYLPEKLRDEYDGTMESLYSIVEEQLMMYAKDYDPSDSEEDEDDEDETVSSSGVMGVEDDEDERPSRKSPTKLGGKKLSGKKSMFKSRPQNSVKPRSSVKSILKSNK